MRRTVILLSAAFLLNPTVGLAQWVTDGLQLSTYASAGSPVIVSSAGGAIVAWLDVQTGSYDVFAQFVDRQGQTKWAANGLPVCTAPLAQTGVRAVPDGADGAIISWYDQRYGSSSPVIFAQRISAAGSPLWTTDGVALSPNPNGLYIVNESEICSDGKGGAIVVWSDNRTGTLDVYAQRITGTGTVLWATGGAVVKVAPLEQYRTVACSDGKGGAIVAWDDGTYPLQVYVQRLGSTGATRWGANGIKLAPSNPTKHQEYPAIAADANGGAIVSWGESSDIYASRVDSTGAKLWGSDGVAVCTAPYGQTLQTVIAVSDGAVVSWQDFRNGYTYDVYAQKVSNTGAILWMADGVPLCTATGDQQLPKIASDGTGGVVAAWMDPRTGYGTDIYAQRVTQTGAPAWQTNGQAVCSAVHSQADATAAFDGSTGIFVAWIDRREDGSTSRPYVQRLSVDHGMWGNPEPWLASAADVPFDQGGKVALNWQRSDLDDFGGNVTHYSMWRAVDVVAMEAAPVSSRVTADEPALISPDFTGTALYHERIGATDYYWEWMANQIATRDPGYSFSAPTRFDSTLADPGTHYFRVIAHTDDPSTYYKSRVLTASSVDNLAPNAPALLTAQRNGSDVVLRWRRGTASDLRDYAVYRADSPGVVPEPGSMILASNDTTTVDANAPLTALYYVVTARDVHDNESPASNEAVISAPTHAGGPPSLSALTVRQNHPNPFSQSTELEIGLPDATSVGIEIYDVAGRRINTLRVGGSAGWQRVQIPGTDSRGNSLASGVYFCRVTDGSSTVTKRMVLIR